MIKTVIKDVTQLTNNKYNPIPFQFCEIDTFLFERNKTVYICHY